MPLRNDRLRDLRQRRGFTLDELADRTEITSRQISRYESGESDATGDAIIKLSKVLGASADYLLGLSNDATINITEENLSQMERKLIDAVRSGLIVEALEAITLISKGKNQPIVTPTQPAVNG